MDGLIERATGSLLFGIVGDAMGTPTENLEPEEIERRFGWLESFEGDGTDDTVMRDLLASALLETGGEADADGWAREWRRQHHAIFGQKVGKFFQSVLHTASKLDRGYLPRTVAFGNMPSSSSAMAIAPIGIVNAGNPRAAAIQAYEVASLIHVGDVAFCQDGAAAIAAAVAAALAPDATPDGVLEAARRAIKPWSGAEMAGLIDAALGLARETGELKAFREAYHARFRQVIACDSRETVPATLALCLLAGGDPWVAVTYGANFGRDADTIACMAGYVCGALRGSAGLDPKHLRGLPAGRLEEQAALARKLIETGRAKARREQAAWQTLAGRE